MTTDQQIAQLCRLVKEQQAQITTLVVTITMQQANIADLIHGQALLTQSIGALLGEEMGRPVTPAPEPEADGDGALAIRGSDSLDPDDD